MYSYSNTSVVDISNLHGIYSDVFDFSINFNSYKLWKVFKKKSGRPKDKRCADGRVFGSDYASK